MSDVQRQDISIEPLSLLNYLCHDATLWNAGLEAANVKTRRVMQEPLAVRWQDLARPYETTWIFAWITPQYIIWQVQSKQIQWKKLS